MGLGDKGLKQRKVGGRGGRSGWETPLRQSPAAGPEHSPNGGQNAMGSLFQSLFPHRPAGVGSCIAPETSST